MDNHDAWNGITRKLLWTGFVMIVAKCALVVVMLVILADKLGPEFRADELITAYLRRLDWDLAIVFLISCGVLVLGGLSKAHKVE